MCAVIIKFRNIKKRCVFFVVPRNGQALLGMPDTAALKLININIESIQVEMPECKTNIEQETHVGEKGCANTDADSKTKQGANGQNGQDSANKSINYFFSSSNVDADKRKSSEMMETIHNTFWGCLMALDASKAHSHYSSNQTANHTRHHPGMWCMHYKNHSKKNWSTCKNGHHHPSRGR